MRDLLGGPRQRRRVVRRVTAARRISPADTLIAAMLAIVDATIPEEDRGALLLSDITRHDRDAIERHPGQPLVWCLGWHGTHMILMGNARGHSRTWDLVRACASECPHVYLYDGVSLAPLASGRDDAIEQIRRACEAHP